MATDPTKNDFQIGALPDPCGDSGSLRTKAARCRRLAAGISDKQAADVLTGMARNYTDAADRLDGTSAADA